MRAKSIGASFLLSVLFLSLVLGTFASCGKGADTDTKKNTENNPSGESESTETEEEDIRATMSDDLPNVTFADQDFHIITRSRDDFRADMGLELEGTTGDTVNDALYLRNMNVEERFQVKLTAQYEDGPTDTAKKLIQSGDSSFSLLLDNAERTGTTVTTGQYRNWKDLPYINLDKPWYINNAKEAMSVAGNSYMMAGEYNISVLRFTYCMYFNKEIAENYNIPDLYAIAKEGKWTYDVLYNMVKDVHDDLDGGGTMDKDDLYGLTTDFYGASTNYMYAMDNPVATMGADGVPQFTYMSDKMTTIYDRVYTCCLRMRAFTRATGTRRIRSGRKAALCSSTLSSAMPRSTVS